MVQRCYTPQAIPAMEGKKQLPEASLYVGFPRKGVVYQGGCCSFLCYLHAAFCPPAVPSPPCQCVPVPGAPSWAVQLGWRGQPPHQLCPHTGGPLEAVSTSAREVTCLPVCQSRVACCSYSCAKDVGLHPITPLAPPVEDEPVWEMFVRWQMLSPPPQHGGRSWQHRGGILQVGSCTSRGAKKKLHLEREKSGGVVVRKGCAPLL